MSNYQVARFVIGRWESHLQIDKPYCILCCAANLRLDCVMFQMLLYASVIYCNVGYDDVIEHVIF